MRTTVDHPVPPRFPSKMHERRLGREDFANGPVVITEGNTLVMLKESVVIDWTALTPPPGTPWHLGFWGALIVQADHVVVDLRGYTIAMSEAYREHQRFFSILEIATAPLPPGRIGFETELRPFHDIVVRNGTLGASSHFGVHSVSGGARWKFVELAFEDYETGCISISACSDLMIKSCRFGAPAPPRTSSLFSAFNDLFNAGKRLSNPAVVKAARAQMQKHAGIPEARVSDSLCRCVVILPSFNVGVPPETFAPNERLRRVAVIQCTFANIRAAPEVVVGCKGGDGKPLKDVTGNLLIHSDVKAAGALSRLQCLVTPSLPSHVRRAVLDGRGATLEPIHGFDIRGHALAQKASCHVRIDGVNGLTLSRLTCGRVHSLGSHGASVSCMLNCINGLIVSHVRIDGVSVAGSGGVLNDDLPQAGLYVRNSTDVVVHKSQYASETACALSGHNLQNLRLCACRLRAPVALFGFDGSKSSDLTLSHQSDDVLP